MAGRWIVVAIALIGLIHGSSFLGAGPHDDDFIVYRYARNLVEGQGLVFQPDERIEGYTTPLWTLLCAALLALGLEPAELSPLLGIAAAALAVWAIGDAWRARHPEDRWPPPALFLAATPAFAWHAVVGLGTTLLAAALALWLRAFELEERAGRRPWASALWLALACALRQECAVFALFYALHARRRSIAAALLPVLALLGWLAFRLAYYGRWLPVSYSVKKLAFAADIDYGIAYLGRATLECGIGLALLLALCIPRGSAALRTVLAGLVAHAVYVVYVGGDYMALARFFVPVLPIAFFLGSIGARSLFASKRNCWVLFTLTGLLALQWTQRERAQLFGEQRFFVERWAALGRHFAAVFPPATRVAISPIGAFGYESRLPLVDILGLTNERILAAEPDLSISMKGHHRFDAEYVLDAAPGAIVLFNGVRQPDTGRWEVNPWERTLYEHPRFSAEYQAVQMPIQGSSDALLFYLRRGQPFPPGASPRER